MQEGALVDAAGRGGKASTSAAKAGRKQAAYVGAEPVSAQHLRPSIAEPDAARASRCVQSDICGARKHLQSTAASTEHAVIDLVVQSVGDLGGSLLSTSPPLQSGIDVAAGSGEQRVPKTLQW